jgi:PIN domain nuclease of toxin-antitoxin system
MNYLADTVAIVRHLRRHPALGRTAARIVSEADAGLHHVYLSAISLMEVLYLSEAKKIDVGLNELVLQISNSRNYSILPMDADVILAAIEIDDVPELHDRILVATAKHFGLLILTGDRVIVQSRYVSTVW